MTINFSNQTKKKAVKYASPFGPNTTVLPPNPEQWPNPFNVSSEDVMEETFANLAKTIKQHQQAQAVVDTLPIEIPATKEHPLLGMPVGSYYVDLVVFTAEKGLSLRCKEHHSYPSLAFAEHQFTLLTSKYANWLKEGKNRHTYISYSKIFPCTPGYDATSSMIDYWGACSPKDKIYVNGPKANFKDKTSA